MAYAHDITADPDAAPDTEAHEKSLTRKGWYAVILLALLYAMSFIDRFILAIVASPMSQSLSLTDGQLGLLLGAGFAVIYGLVGIPLAQWIDARDRRKMLVAGVLLWSSMTIASAFADNFTHLLIARSGVAIGEAVLSPAAISLIADFFIKSKRALPMTVYTSVSGFMGTGAFIVGGGALAMATSLSPSMNMEAWRLALILVGVPGIALGFLFFFTVKEPPRRSSGVKEVDDATLGTFLKYLKTHWTFYLPFILSGTLLCTFSLSMVVWMPTLLTRAHGFTPAEAGATFGLFATPTTLLCTMIWPWLATRIEKRKVHLGVPTGLLMASFIALPVFMLAPLLGNAWWFLTGITVSIVASSAWSVLPPLGFQIFGPPRMRGRLAALSLLGMNLIGFGIGPSLVVFFGRVWEGAGVPDIGGLTTNGLAWGLGTVGMITAPLMLICTLVCVRTVRHLPELKG